MKAIVLLSNRIALGLLAIMATVLLSGCDNDDPKKEDTPELITKVTLTFTPFVGGTPIVVNATDPDGEGPQDIEVDGPINLWPNTGYVLRIKLINELADPSAPEYDISEEVKEEGDEHMFFFSWTNNVFGDPEGNGNIDDRADAINYEDKDVNNLPLGLVTFWLTENLTSGTFRILLKHQPGVKSATSASSVGETDLDLTFTVNVQ